MQCHTVAKNYGAPGPELFRMNNLKIMKMYGIYDVLFFLHIAAFIIQ
jgi:hypothetical protein